jgi:hypothetical protein
MSRKTLVVVAVFAAMILATGSAIALTGNAAVSHYGPVTVVPSDTSDFTSSGTLISGWYWLRDTALTNVAVWKFSGLPTAKGVAKSNRIYLRFNTLVTNKASGGSGYNASVWISYISAKGKVVKSLITLHNLHPEILDPRNTSGFGYDAYGYLSVPVSSIPTGGKLAVTMKRGVSTKRHVAANADTCTAEYLTP